MLTFANMQNDHKPNDGEFPIFYKGYIDTLKDEPLITTLTSETQHALAVMRRIPIEKTTYRYQLEKWSVRQVLIHILDTEMVFGYRGLAIARGEKQMLPGYNQDEYMAGVDPSLTNLNELISCFEHLRSANISFYKMLREKDLERTGTASGYKVSARTIGYFIAGHCRYHVNMLQDRYGI